MKALKVVATVAGVLFVAFVVYANSGIRRAAFEYEAAIEEYCDTFAKCTPKDNKVYCTWMDEYGEPDEEWFEDRPTTVDEVYNRVCPNSPLHFKWGH